MLKSSVDPNKFETLIEINTLINSDYSDAKALLTRILESATRLTDAEASSLLLLNAENNKLYFEIALGTKAQDVKKYSLNVGEGIAGWVAEHNRSLVVNDVADDSRFYSEISRNIGFPTASILAAPMRIRERCVGVIELINKKNRKPFDQEDLFWIEIFANQAALAVQNAHNFQRVRDEIDNLNEQIISSQGYHTLIYRSKIIEEKMQIVSRAARSDSSVLILGESGVGKELFAEQLHMQSNRRDQPLIRVNCAALAESLLESELFGHVKGAFTDASSERRGRFELADGGTIFLDEIGEVPLPVQAKLLRVIQHKTFEKLGASEQIHVDVRIIAATNRDIEKAVDEGKFRNDLFYRLNVLPLAIPPLRQRREDIPVLADYFLKKFNREVKKQIRGFTDSALEALLTYSWPGNVRELENAIERSVVICQDDRIKPSDLILQPTERTRGEEYTGKTLKDSINLFKRHLIESTLSQHGWNQTVTAKVLGIQRTYLSRLMKELAIRN
jgi:Nif-specific regulatory protein